MNTRYLSFFYLCFILCAFMPYRASATQAEENDKGQKRFQHSVTGQMKTHTALHEDTLAELAGQYHVGYVEILAANPKIDPWLPGEGSQIIIPDRHLLPDAPHKGIVVNLGEMRLYYYKDSNSPPQSYPLGIGRDGLSTPTGTTKIVRKKEGPKWRPTARMRKLDPSLPKVVEAGEDNPLGTHALYLGWPSYLIHGTYKPLGIGRRVSSGCIRMYPEHIIKLFEQVDPGTPVNVINQPIKVGWIDGNLYLEAQPSSVQADEVEFNAGIRSFVWPDGLVAKIKKQAGEKKVAIDWVQVQKILSQRQGIPINIMKKP